MDHAAHHPKSDVPTEHQLEVARLQSLWRLRQQHVEAGTFVPVDPIADRRRQVADYFAFCLMDAWKWLIARKAEKALLKRFEARNRFHVIQGGRL